MYVMAYFRLKRAHLYLAVSEDLYHWQPLNNNEPILDYKTRNAQIIRDPFIIKGEDNRWHLVFTTNWDGQNIGYSVSDDLIHWEKFTVLPVMTEFEGTKNCWAPEIIYDHLDKEYILFWSSNVDTYVAERYNYHLIYCCTTKDFKTFSPTTLFFDPGYSCIDASITYHEGKYYMAFKDERGRNEFGTQFKAIRVCVSDKAKGPYCDISDLVTPHLSEGPCIVKTDSGYMLFYDNFYDEYYGASVSSDFKNWEVVTHKCKFPPTAKHASVFKVDQSTWNNLQGYK